MNGLSPLPEDAVRAPLWQGLPCHEVNLPCGDRLVVAEHGAQLLSWVATGRERLFLSALSRCDGQSALRGGIPVCWPQFNQRGTLPKHGFVRNLPWRLVEACAAGDEALLVMECADSSESRRHWHHAFHLRLAAQIRPGQLRVELQVYNTGTEALAFTGALHTYLRVQDIGRVSVSGLAGQVEWDAVADTRQMAPVAPLRFSGEFDRVYAAAAQALEMRDGDSVLSLQQSSSWPQTVVWNPGALKAAELPDMREQDHRVMLCIEAARVYEPHVLPVGQSWTGWQSLSVLRP